MRYWTGYQVRASPRRLVKSSPIGVSNGRLDNQSLGPCSTQAFAIGYALHSGRRTGRARSHGRRFIQTS